MDKKNTVARESISNAKFYFRYIARNANLFFIVILSFILPGFLFVQYMREIVFISGSAETEATVISKHFRPNDNKLSRYSVVYSFKDGAGTIYRSSSEAGRFNWEKITDGQTIPVRYSKKDPSMSKAWKMTLLMSPLSYEFQFVFFPFILTPLFFIQGLFFLSILKKDVSYVRPIFIDGLASSGEIIKTAFQKDKRASFYDVNYDFRIESGRTYSGNFQYPSRYEQKTHPEKGLKGLVFYLQEDPSHNIWVGEDWKAALSLYRRYGFSAKERKSVSEGENAEK